MPLTAPTNFTSLTNLLPQNGGHCQPLLFERGPDVAAFELRNYYAIKSYIADNNISCEWRAVPGCRSFWTKALAKAAAKDVRDLQNADPEIGKEVRVIENEEEIRKLRVNGAPGVMLTAVAASLWPYKLIAFMLEKLVKTRGLNLQTKTPVTKISSCSPSLVATVKGLRYTLGTPRGAISARHVILATNGYTSHLLPSFTNLIVPERGVMTALLPLKKSSLLSTSHGFVGANGANPIHDDYLIQRPCTNTPNPKGYLMFGGGNVGKTLKMVGETDDGVVDGGCVAYLKKALLGLLDLGGEAEGAKELECEYAWSGIWGTSIDQHPWVGAVPDDPGIWLAGGYSGHGMPNGMLCGKAVVDMLLAQEAGEDLKVVQEQMVKRGDLPKAYLITKERIVRCKMLDSVEVQDEKGLEAFRHVTGLPGPQQRQEAKL